MMVAKEVSPESRVLEVVPENLFDQLQMRRDMRRHVFQAYRYTDSARELLWESLPMLEVASGYNSSCFPSREYGELLVHNSEQMLSDSLFDPYRSHYGVDNERILKAGMGNQLLLGIEFAIQAVLPDEARSKGILPVGKDTYLSLSPRTLADLGEKPLHTFTSLNNVQYLKPEAVPAKTPLDALSFLAEFETLPTTDSVKAGIFLDQEEQNPAAGYYARGLDYYVAFIEKVAKGAKSTPLGNGIRTIFHEARHGEQPFHSFGLVREIDATVRTERVLRHGKNLATKGKLDSYGYSRNDLYVAFTTAMNVDRYFVDHYFKAIASPYPEIACRANHNVVNYEMRNREKAKKAA